MPKIRSLIAALFAFFISLLSIAVLVPVFVVGYWYLDQQYPLGNLSVRFDRWDEFEPHTAIITWKGDRDRVCPGKGYRWVESDHPYVVPPIDLPPPGATDKIGAKGILITVPVPIPQEALRTAKDSVTLRFRLVWQCNPLHQYWPLVLDAPEITIPVPTRVR